MFFAPLGKQDLVHDEQCFFPADTFFQDKQHRVMVIFISRNTPERRSGSF